MAGALLLLGAATGVHAQTASAPRAAASRRLASLEVSAGGGWLGGAATGERDAALQANAPGSQPFRLFLARTRVLAVPVLTGRMGWQIAHGVALEGRLGFSRPSLRTIVSGDVESSGQATVTEWLTQYDIDGGVRALVPVLRVGSARPFLTGGVGLARRVHAGRVLIETDRTFYVGSGVRYPWRPPRRGTSRSSGLRVDVRMDVLTRTALGEATAVRPAIDASIFIAF